MKKEELMERLVDEFRREYLIYHPEGLGIVSDMLKDALNQAYEEGYEIYNKLKNQNEEA